MLQQLPNVPTRFDTFALQGGLDLHTPQMQMRPGVAREAINFECSIGGGYTRVGGYERFDGRPSPSAALFNAMTVTLTGTLAVGNTLTGATSAATGAVALIETLPAVNGVVRTLVIVTRTTGSFTTGESVRVGGVTVGTLLSASTIEPDQARAAAFALAAANVYRASITAVPGSGPVRGIFTYSGAIYAWRNNAANTACVLHKSSPTGWAAVPMLNELRFEVGTGTPPAEGSTITKGAVSAVVRRVILQSGSWASSTAAGRFIIDAPTGGNFTAGALTAGGAATLLGAQTAISFLPSGTFSTDAGDAGLGQRIYGVDGVNRAWEFDGTVLAPIVTGNASDAPACVKAHAKHLFLSFGSSLQNSSIAQPHMWSAVTGAAEIKHSQTITALLQMPGDSSTPALAVMGDSSTSILYGSSSADFRLIDFNNESGAKPRSAQRIRDGYVFDDSGVMSLTSAQQFGNFQAAYLTLNIRSFTQVRRTLVTDSLVNREKNQYRLFFSDGYGLYTTLVNGQWLGSMPVLFPNPVACACSGESSNGAETSYFGSTNGMVYRMDVGTSFDGAPIEASFALAYTAQRSQQVAKRYRRIAIELQGEGYAEFGFGHSLSYGGEQANATAIKSGAKPSYWDAFTWDSFIWDGRVVAPAYARLEGSAENISLAFYQSSALWPSYTINGVTLQYTPRRILRY